MPCSFLTHILFVLFCPCSSSSWIIQGAPVCSLPFLSLSRPPFFVYQAHLPRQKFSFPPSCQKDTEITDVKLLQFTLRGLWGFKLRLPHVYIKHIAPWAISQYPCFSLLIYHPVFPAERLIFSGPPLLESSRFPSGCPQQDCRGGWLDHRLGY